MVKRKIVWSKQAEFDLYEIIEYYIKLNGNKTFSNKLNSSLIKSVKLLGIHPYLGIQADILNTRSLTEGNFSIFYEIKSETIEIIALWDNRQNPENLHIKS